MAGVSCVLSEDQFLCSICLDVFTDPVTTSCGHSFCKICINKHWDNNNQCHCPVCKEDFSTRPQLKISTCLSEMVSEFKNKPQTEDTVSSEPQAAEPGDVMCDVCSGPKLKALKSCLVCQTSYCQSHLEPHITIPRLKRHQLIRPVEKLEDRICPKHDKPLELFCKDDSEFICLQCIYSDHKSHDAVPLKEQCEEKQTELKKKIEERRLKIQEIQSSVELSQKNSDKEMEKGVQFFNALMKCVQQSLDQFKHSIEEKHKKTEEQAAELIQGLETEISELEQRRAEMEELWSSDDHFHFLQTFTSVKPAPELRDWTELTVRAPLYQGRVSQAVSELENMVLIPNIRKLFKDELKIVKQHAVNITLDPNTLHPNLVLSPDHKQVCYSNHAWYHSDSPIRFSTLLYVLGKQKFSFGKFYFEVQVKGKTGWCLGVAKESVNRKGDSGATTPQNGYWIISGGSNSWLMWSTPEKVGVFVDYEEGLVCFYDADTAELIHSFTDCCFTENILPLFCPCNNTKGNNSAPLILTPVTVELFTQVKKTL